MSQVLGRLELSQPRGAVNVAHGKNTNGVGRRRGGTPDSASDQAEENLGKAPGKKNREGNGNE